MHSRQLSEAMTDHLIAKQVMMHGGMTDQVAPALRSYRGATHGSIPAVARYHIDRHRAAESRVMSDKSAPCSALLPQGNRNTASPICLMHVKKQRAAEVRVPGLTSHLPRNLHPKTVNVTMCVHLGGVVRPSVGKHVEIPELGATQDRCSSQELNY